jgi:hypothetical protein
MSFVSLQAAVDEKPLQYEVVVYTRYAAEQCHCRKTYFTTGAATHLFTV